MERVDILNTLVDWLPDSHVEDDPYIDAEHGTVSVEYGDSLDTDYEGDDPIGKALHEQRNRLLFDTAYSIAKAPGALRRSGWTPDRLWENRCEWRIRFCDAISDTKMDDVEHEYRIYASFTLSQDWERGVWRIVPVLEIGGKSFELPEITLLPWGDRQQLENALLHNYPWRML